MEGEFARGEIRSNEVRESHSSGFDQALDRALNQLDRDDWGKEFSVRYFIAVTENPGGVGHYIVQLDPTG